jgi:hypothetical protein
MVNFNAKYKGVAANYFSVIHAPAKRIFWFEDMVKL